MALFYQENVIKMSEVLVKIRAMKKITKTLLEIIFPKSCVNCERYDTRGLYVCAECAEQILFADGPVTAEEGKKLKLDLGGRAAGAGDGEIDETGKGERSEIFLDGYEVVTVFSPPVSSLVKALKYRGAAEAAETLGEWLWWWAKVPWEIDYVCHVPLHWRRYGERGFNQANLIARAFCKMSGREHWPILERKQHTLNQAAADYEQRLSQLNGIFRVREKFWDEGEIGKSEKNERNEKSEKGEKLTGKKVLVIDDVMTTGSTFNECARALKRAGVARVYGLAVAKG